MSSIVAETNVKRTVLWKTVPVQRNDADIVGYCAWLSSRRVVMLSFMLRAILQNLSLRGGPAWTKFMAVGRGTSISFFQRPRDDILNCFSAPSKT